MERWIEEGQQKWFGERVVVIGGGGGGDVGVSLPAQRGRRWKCGEVDWNG